MTQHPTTRLVLEGLMYMAFTAAALPMAWLGVSELLFYRSHPDLLESRDAAPMVFAAVGAAQVMAVALGLAALLAAYFLVTGTRAIRYSTCALIVAWVLAFSLGRHFVASTPFASMARLYWDAVPFAALCLLPGICAGGRVALRSARSS